MTGAQGRRSASSSTAERRNRRASAMTPRIHVPELELPLDEQVVRSRRDFHRYAESGWCEFRTASKVARTLTALGLDVALGRDVVTDHRMGLPPEEELERELERALDQGADEEFARLMAGGFTGVVATLRGELPGPTVALRFDMDANRGAESIDRDHAPAMLGYASVNAGTHHNCGHDGHTAIGLGVARRISELAANVRGEIRLVFQPAEEGLRGGAAMVAAGVARDVDIFLACHLGVQARRTGEVVAGYNSILASTKFDAEFVGRSAHASISPHLGRNALGAAAAAALSLLALPRHGEGETRVNVGRLAAGEARNAIPDHAMLLGEIRSDRSDILEFLSEQVTAVVEGAARMYGVDATITEVGRAGAASSDAELSSLVADAARRCRGVQTVRDCAEFKGSDDATCFMDEVAKNGGKAAYVGIGADLADAHHAARFDFDEAALPIGVEVLVACLPSLGVLGSERPER